MATRFRRSRGGVVVTFHPDEAPILRSLLGQLTEMVDEAGAGDTEEDDPAVARLFPDAYPDDAESAGEFRRYTERGLRDRKREAAATALATLAEPGHRRTLSEHEAQAWLTTLADLRLVLGTRLDVTEDWGEQYASLPDDDPRRALFEAYDWLSFLQESLVHALW